MLWAWWWRSVSAAMTGGFPLFLPACSTHTHTLLCLLWAYFCSCYLVLIGVPTQFPWRHKHTNKGLRLWCSFTAKQNREKGGQGRTQAIDLGAREHSLSRNRKDRRAHLQPATNYHYHFVSMSSRCSKNVTFWTWQGRVAISYRSILFPLQLRHLICSLCDEVLQMKMTNLMSSLIPWLYFKAVLFWRRLSKGQNY